MNQRVRLPLVAMLLVLSSPAADACSIPVFRYALERWAPSPFEVLVYRRGPLNESDRNALRAVESYTIGTNVDFTEIDLDGRDDKLSQAIWDANGKEMKLPCLMIRFPESDAKMPLAWKGPIDLEKIKPIVMSPVRERIARKLIHGDSAVFLLLESGDAAADDAAEKLLREQLAKLEKSIELPALTKDGPQLRSELPLRISLPVMRLSRTQAGEQGLVELLLKCEDGLDKANGPIVFTIFGRGRVLTALHGKDLAAKEIEGVTRFLCGACSCQVKELNPGVDLLFNTRWEAILEVEVAPSPKVVSPEKP